MNDLVASFRIDPMGAPRLTRNMYWTPIAKRYFAYKDRLRELAHEVSFTLPESYHLVFFLPMAASWPLKKRNALRGQPHKNVKPDKDNLEKAFLDAILKDDSGVWDGRVTKYWADEGEIEVYRIEPPELLIL